MKRIQINIEGQVQGVGFRPYVYRIANELALTGYVQNNASGVKIEIQGLAIETFLQRLQSELPPLADIEKIDQKKISLNKKENTFTIKKSQSGNISTKISPDVTICEDCLKELFDPNHHYYRYPLINCTHCGPRYTITHHLPYDRNSTSMAAFKMCHDCRSHYENPADRRYHAQPIACHQCGPKLSHSMNDIADTIASGKIVALKTLGGYQLICDANNDHAIKRLRNNKNRPTKPFAVMTLNAISAKQIVHCSKSSETLLTSRKRPIVILPKKNNQSYDQIAPNLNSLGTMLPYTPIHYLLFNALLGSPDGTGWINESCNFILVVTSANPNGCPLIKDDDEAREKLTTVADSIVNYNRNIVIRADDSVVSLVNDKMVFIRRARSYVPRAIPLPYEIPTTLALGGYLKNTICLTRGREAFLSQHIGDLNHRDTLRFYRETMDHLIKILDVKPKCVARDRHPNFYSTQIANEFNVPNFEVQHHHAHLAACAVEHGLTKEAIGLALDGFGLGDNFESWGGELIQYQNTTFKRLGFFKPIMQPGGDIAARQPWRMAASILFELGKKQEIAKRFSNQSQAKSLIKILERKINSPFTSSCGRLFDAASALLGICDISNYEGEAAMLLESRVTELLVAEQGWEIHSNQLNLLPLFRELLHCDATLGANLFHGTLATALVEWVKQNAKKQKITHVLMSGGCFLNKILSEWMIKKLKTLRLIPLFPIQCPPNDGGISLGQAWIAGNKMREKS